MRQLCVMGVSLEEASGAVVIVETSPRNISAMKLLDEISNFIKSKGEEAVVLVSASSNHDLGDDAFNLYLAVRE